MKFMKGLNSRYKYYVEYYEYGIKAWPITLEEAYLEMAKERRTLPPNATNILAVKYAAGSDKVAGELRGCDPHSCTAVRVQAYVRLGLRTFRSIRFMTCLSLCLSVS